MDRRSFLRGLLGATALTAAGLVVPSRTTYCFLTNNPLAETVVTFAGEDAFEAVWRSYADIVVMKPNQIYRLDYIAPGPSWAVIPPGEFFA